MLDANVLLLGLIAGFTIFLGLPVARLNTQSPRLKGVLNSVTIGILFFLFVEVTEHSWVEVEGAVERAAEGTAGWGEATVFFALFAAGFAVGLLSLVLFENRFLRAAPVADTAPEAKPKYDETHRMALLIAVGVGLHNFSEGLAIGASAAAGAITFAVVLAIGFALHNATEGFGIAAPLAGTRPAWSFLALAGLIGGGPTFLGTVIGSLATSTPVSVLFLALAGGALLYVIKQLFVAGRVLTGDPKHNLFVMGGIVLGLVIGFGTELAVELAAA